MDKLDKVYSKKFSSDPDNLVEVEKFISDIADEFNVDEEIKSNLTLSVSEASSNAMVHGNKLDPKKEIELTVSLFKDSIKVVIKDQGNGFDPNAVPDPTAPENLLKDSGRGIFIMKSFLKELKYNFTDSGTEVILEISLS